MGGEEVQPDDSLFGCSFVPLESFDPPETVCNPKERTDLCREYTAVEESKRRSDEELVGYFFIKCDGGCEDKLWEGWFVCLRQDTKFSTH